jgi:hypothetical protein
MRPFLFLITLLHPALGHAWGQAGHRIVGEVAQRHLNPTARAEVESLLREFEPPGAGLASVSTWADEIKRDPAWDHTRPWHYSDLPADNTDGYVAARDCAAGGCVVEAILRSRDVLANETASRREKSMALKFLVHFVGDIHQPLHVGRSEDNGGTDIHVRHGGERRTLHWVWDVALVTELWPIWEDGAELIRQHLQGRPGLAEQWSTTDVVAWANESHRLALETAYQIRHGGAVDPEYIRRCMPVARLQLARGGVRLAAMLNEIWPERVHGWPMEESVFGPVSGEETPADLFLY